MPDSLTSHPAVIASASARTRRALGATVRTMTVTWPELPESDDMARRARRYLRQTYRAARAPLGALVDVDDGMIFGKAMGLEVARAYTLGFMALCGWQIIPL